MPEPQTVNGPGSVGPVAANQNQLGYAERVSASGLIAQATNPVTQTVDTRRLAGLVVDAARQDYPAASRAHAEIEAQLLASNPADAVRFNTDVREAASSFVPGPAGLSGASQGLADAGYRVLVNNPILDVRWESTRSPITNAGGFTSGLEQLLTRSGVPFEPSVNAVPPGAVTPNATISRGQANNINGDAARDAIARRLQTDFPDATVRTEVNVQNGARRLDVVADVPNPANLRNATRIEIESKLGRQGPSGLAPRQIEFDAARLADNQAIRQGGRVLENVGRVARPIGVVMDVVEVGQAFRADGDRVGEHTGRAASGVAGGALGGWGGAVGGAAAGAALGSVVPIVGTAAGAVVGGLIGATGGAIVGDGIGKRVFDGIRSLF